jgi:hypothetical protein
MDTHVEYVVVVLPMPALPCYYITSTQHVHRHAVAWMHMIMYQQQGVWHTVCTAGYYMSTWSAVAEYAYRHEDTAITITLSTSRCGHSDGDTHVMCIA